MPLSIILLSVASKSLRVAGTEDKHWIKLKQGRSYERKLFCFTLAHYFLNLRAALLYTQYLKDRFVLKQKMKYRHLAFSRLYTTHSNSHEPGVSDVVAHTINQHTFNSCIAKV